MRWTISAIAAFRGAAMRSISNLETRRGGAASSGVFYNHQISKGRNRDTAWYSILDDEWPEVRELIKAWLDDGNFDGAGVARRSLSGIRSTARSFAGCSISLRRATC
jgi:hypothetical protein